MKGKNLLLRHDIDIDPAAAIEMAKTEQAIGARATYFILLTNRHTNPLDKDFRDAVRNLFELGHWIGLHFDATQYDLHPADENFAGFVQQEADILEMSVGVSVDAVSFHRPAKELLESSGSITAPFPHTYESVFLRQIEYCSDSSGTWTYGPPQGRNAHRLGNPFHFLTHPIWWGHDDIEPVSRITDWMTKRVCDDFSYELPGNQNPFGSLK